MSSTERVSGEDQEGSTQEPVLVGENPPRYAIRSVRDFLAVPEDRIGECLREFALMLELARNSIGLLDAVSDEIVGKGQIAWQMTDTFTWIDDNLGTATMRILTHEPPDIVGS